MDYMVEERTSTLPREEALSLLERLRSGETIPRSELDFRGVSLPGANLTGLQLSGADFTDADLSGAKLTGAALFKATCVRASMVGADLEGAELAGADLSQANLENANARKAGFGLAVLRDARLFSINLEEATLTKADLSGADVRCAHLNGARIREANLTGSDFTAADLRGADLSLTRLDRAVFNNTDLRESRLRAVDGFQTAEWIGADIRDINFAGAYRLRRHLVDENYLWEFRKSSKLSAFIYSIWKLTSDCGRSIGRWCIWIVAQILLFAGLYSMVGVDFGPDRSWVAPLYLSVVTLTTLGYGDMVPVTSAARIVAMTQVLLGYVLLGGLLSILATKMARRGE
ncbi:MAG: pentapeptide repeat-containing protein [Candidatus Eisenbacteria sp.]|nr:pentapeptide repeat-containing protein [Candidatus Eisenbacteria bacterium]